MADQGSAPEKTVSTGTTLLLEVSWLDLPALCTLPASRAKRPVRPDVRFRPPDKVSGDLKINIVRLIDHGPDAAAMILGLGEWGSVHGFSGGTAETGRLLTHTNDRSSFLCSSKKGSKKRY